MRMNDENDESDLIGLEEMVIGSNSFPVATSMTLRMLPNVREIVLSNNTLNEVEELFLSGIGDGGKSIVQLSNNTLLNLKSITIGDDSDNEIAEWIRNHVNENPGSNVSIVVDPILPNQIFKVRNENEMSDIPSDVKILSFDDNTWNDESVSVLNVSNWRSIRNVSIGWNCLESVNHVEARGLGELEAFNVEENSLLNAMSFSIDYSSVVSRKVIVRSMSELNEMSIAVSKLVIGDDSCNELLSEEEEVLNLSRFVNVRRILIGSNALMNVRKVMARGLLNLESLEIGSGSLVNVREFEIDVGSVVRWSYVIRDSVIVDLIPYVVSDLVIADNCCNEVNFTCLDLSRFVNLRSIRIGSNCLNHVRSVLTEGLIHLESLIVGERSLMNAGEIEMSNSVDIEWVYEANDMMSVVNAPSVISKLMIGDNCCNEVNFTSLDLSRFVHLKSLVIGKNSLNHVKNVTTCGVSELKLIEVGENSLVEVNEVDMNEATMINWAFEANSMTSVLNAPVGISKLIIADNCCNEVNFTSLDLSRFVHLKSLVIGKNSLNEIVNITGVEYELLNEVIIGENSLSSLSHS